MKKKVISILLAAAMTVSLLACGSEADTGKQENKGEAEKTQEASEKQESSAQESSEPEVIDPTAPYEETVTITVGHLITSVITEYAEGDDLYNNAWIREYKERYNIEFDIVFAEKSENYATKVNLAMAEKNLPDVFYVTAAQLDQLVEADLLYDLTDVFEVYATDSIKAIAAADETTFETAKRDGRLYAMPQFDSGFLPQFKMMWIRKDWMEGLGLEAPETMDDLVAIAEAFMEEYGASYGIATNKSLYPLFYLAPAWGAYPDIWVETEDGQIGYGGIQPEMKDALAAWAQWYQDGLLCSDFATMAGSDVRADSLNNEVGMYANDSNWGTVAGPDQINTLGVEAIYEPYLIPTATGEDVLYPLTSSNGGYVVVSKDCEHPEAIFKMLDLYNLVRYDQDFAVDEPEKKAALYDNHMQHWPQELRILNNTTEGELLHVVSDAVEKKDSTGLKGDALSRYNQCIDFLEKGDPSCAGRYLQMETFKLADELLENGQTIENQVWGISTETMNQSGSVLFDILVEGYTKIIMGDEPVDYFDELVESWKKAGGDQMTQEVNEYYGK